MKLIAEPGEHPLNFEAGAGKVEAILSIPEKKRSSYIAMIGHPHSLYGGTMQNKVVTTLAKVFTELGIINCRMNFRGVGRSEGYFDAGIGESEDMLSIASLLMRSNPGNKLIYAGFSFGSFVTYRAAAQSESALLVSIAPPVSRFDYTEFKAPSPWLIIQGDADEIVDPTEVFDFANKQHPPLPVIRFEETGHFFHGKLIELKEKLSKAIPEFIAL